MKKLEDFISIVIIAVIFCCWIGIFFIADTPEDRMFYFIVLNTCFCYDLWRSKKDKDE